MVLPALACCEWASLGYGAAGATAWRIARIGGHHLRHSIRQVVMLVVVGLLVIVQALPGVAREHERPAKSDCSRTSTGAVPLIDLGSDLYQGEQGGLYPGGSNDIPSEHEALGLFMASQIEPLDEAGNPDPNGTIVLVSLGVSNTRMEFEDFMTIAEGSTAPSVVLVNASQPGKPISSWVDPSDRPWIGVDGALRQADVSGAQVQVAWIKIPERITSFDELEPFPIDAETYQSDFIQVIQNAKERYPNLKVAYLSSRIYGGYDPNARPNPEPLAYQNGFAVKWTVEEQINGNPDLNTDARTGPVVAPWVAWGPYMWADGTTPRSDGLIWECSDLQGDGTHPTEEGRRKVAIMLLDHFLSDPTAAPWFAKDGVEIDDVELPPVVTGGSSSTTVVTTTLVTTTLAPSTTIFAAATTTAAATSTTQPSADAQATTTRPREDSVQSRSSDEASAALILAATVAGLAVIAGIAWLVMSRRKSDES